MLGKLKQVFWESAILHEREWQKAVRALAQRPGILFDMGGGAPFQGYIKEDFLASHTLYFSLDIVSSVRPNLIGDLTKIPLATESTDSILCNAVLEHVIDPQAAVHEMYRVLKPGGHALFTVPFIYPYHDWVDYYRFTDVALGHLFRNFSELKIVPKGDYFYVTLLFLTGFSETLTRLLSPLLVIPRLGLRMAVIMYNWSVPEQRRRDYLRSLTRSPVGWYIYCQK
jgi:SAM-dependent methyltransferase